MSATPSSGESAPRPACPSLLEWAILVVGAFLVHRYSWLLDDAFVYFRYIDNYLYLDRGLVYNAGEYVEGFTSPLWLGILMALRWVGIDYLEATPALGLLSFAGFWLLLVQLNARLSPPDRPRVNFPLAYLGLNYGVLCYFTSGVEAPLVAVAAAALALYFVAPGSLVLEVILGLSPLIRPDLAAPLLMLLAWSWWSRGRFPSRLLALTLVPNLAWLAFRIYYYADLFPNTYYVKNVVMIGQGLFYVDNSLQCYGFYAVAVAAVAAVVYLAKKETPHLHLKERGLICLVGLVMVAYVVKVGGDSRHFRFAAYFFVLFICATGGLSEHLLARLSTRLPRAQRALAVAAAFVTAIVSFSFYPRQLDMHPVRPEARGHKIRKVEDAVYHRTNRAIRSYARWRVSFEPERLSELPVEYDYGETMLQNGCWLSYQRIDRPALHIVGLAHAVMARLRVPHEVPAHKPLLRPHAKFVWLLYRSGIPIGPGMFRESIARGMAPAWVEENLEKLEIIERKMFNRHDFIENLGLALQFPMIDPPIGIAPPDVTSELDRS